MNSSNLTAVDTPISTWDWIEIGYSLIAALIGIPLNLFIFIRLIRQIYYGKSTRLTLLSLQINISDIMILVVKCVAYSVWMIVQQWYAGNVCCKIFQFFVLFPFYLSSNCRVSLALDLCQSVCFPMSIRITANRYARIYIVVSWLVAIASAAPQVYFFQSQELSFVREGFTQCFNFLHLSNDTKPYLIQYDMYHVLVVFWIPLCLIIALYVAITVEGFRALNRQMGMKTGKDSHMDKPKSFATRCLACFGRKKETEPISDAVMAPLLVQQSAKLMNCDKNDQDPDVTRKITVELQRREKAEALQQQALTRARTQKMKILRFSLSIILAYLFCWLPYQIKALYELLVDSTKAAISDKYLHWLSAIMILNSVLNPFLYGFGQTAVTSGRRNTETTMAVTSAI